MSERLVLDWQKEIGISTGSYRYDFIRFELGHYTAERNQILQLSSPRNQCSNTTVIHQQENILKKFETCSNSPALVREISQRQPLFASGNYCHEIISESFYQSNDTDNDDEMFTMPHYEPQKAITCH